MIDADLEDQMIQLARQVRKYAYAPYSQYQVGATVLMEGDQIFAGVNVENVSYGGALCAERTALCSAIAGGARKLLAVAVVTKDGGFPCGFCRQVLCEFGNPWILVATMDQKALIHRMQLSELLPHPFRSFESE
jgi:cytidine deaminase